MTWYNLRLDKVAYVSKLMSNLESLLSGAASITGMVVGGGSLSSSLYFQIGGTDKATIPWPVGSTSQRVAITPGMGAAFYDSSVTSLYIYDSANWVQAF